MIVENPQNKRTDLIVPHLRGTTEPEPVAEKPQPSVLDAVRSLINFAKDADYRNTISPDAIGRDISLANMWLKMMEDKETAPVPLTAQDVANMRKRYSEGEELADLAEEYHMESRDALNAITGRSFRHADLLHAPVSLRT